MSYILKSKQEYSRLDNQTKAQAYSIENEFKDINLRPESSLLDAGCGSAVLYDFINENYSNISYSGCDQNIESVYYCRNNINDKKAHIYQHDFVKKPFSYHYDYIINRLVAHHLNKTEFNNSIQNFYDALNGNGKLILVDIDGLLVNLCTANSSLNKRMSLLLEKFPGNLGNIRLAPSYMNKAGFKDIKWNLTSIDIKGIQREKEVEQWEERFENSIDFYVKVLGSKLEAKRFFKDYITELKVEHNPYFYNKFIVTGLKV